MYPSYHEERYYMNIAIAVDGDSMLSPVAEQFERCTSLLIVDTETMDVLVVSNPETTEKLAGQRLAESVLEHNCECVITGLIRHTAFELMANGNVTRYFGRGHRAIEALDLMGNRALEFIRDADGGEGCGGTHHH